MLVQGGEELKQIQSAAGVKLEPGRSPAGEIDVLVADWITGLTRAGYRGIIVGPARTSAGA